MDKSKETRKRPLATPNTTDDESITTSTASDALDSWTLITDKKNSKTTKTTHISEDESNVEDLPKYEDLDLETSQSTAKEEQETEPSPEHHADTTSVTDEFSDEVSIISESENGDVLAPHPYLREHLQTLNLKFTTGQGLDLASLLQQQQQEEHRLQQRYDEEQTTPPNTPIQLTHRSNNNGGSYQARQRKRRSPSIDATLKSLRSQTATEVRYSVDVRGDLRRRCKLIFYTSIVLIGLSLYGNVSFPEWPFGNQSSEAIAALDKKLVDMELQNNLMRAEIDLLTKQVNYLRTMSLPKNGDKNDKYPTKQENKYNPENNQKRKLDKEPVYNINWGLGLSSGDEDSDYDYGNTEEPTDVEEPVNISSDIIESPPESILPVVETPQSTEEQPNIEENKQAPPSKYYDNDDHILRERFNKHYGKERRDSASNNEEKFRKKDERAENLQRQNKKYNSKERFDDNNSGEPENFKKDSKERYNEKDNSKEHSFKKDYNKHKPNNNNDNSSERKYKKEDSEYKPNNMNNSKEHKYKKEDNDNSKEHKYKREDNEHKRNKNDNSKERYHRKDYSQEEYRRTENFNENQQQKRRRPQSKERFENDKNTGEWHEKLMQHREKSRNDQEQRLKREKNWYLNRNDGREQWRSEETNRR